MRRYRAGDGRSPPHTCPTPERRRRSPCTVCRCCSAVWRHRHPAMVAVHHSGGLPAKPPCISGPNQSWEGMRREAAHCRLAPHPRCVRPCCALAGHANIPDDAGRLCVDPLHPCPRHGRHDKGWAGCRPRLGDGFGQCPGCAAAAYAPSPNPLPPQCRPGRGDMHVLLGVGHQHANPNAAGGAAAHRARRQLRLLIACECQRWPTLACR